MKEKKSFDEFQIFQQLGNSVSGPIPKAMRTPSKVLEETYVKSPSQAIPNHLLVTHSNLWGQKSQDSFNKSEIELVFDEIEEKSRKELISQISKSAESKNIKNEIVSFGQIENLEQFVKVFTFEAMKVEKIFVDLLHKKEQEILEFRQRVI